MARQRIVLIIMLLSSFQLKIEKAWNKGFSLCGSVTDSSICYVAKYCINKKVFPFNQNEPFSLSSSRPGIGNSFLQTPRAQAIADGSKTYISLSGNRKIAVPRYYRDKLKPPPLQEDLSPPASLFSHRSRRDFLRVHPGATFKDWHEACLQYEKQEISSAQFLSSLKSKI